jgi:hypothetical protein
MKRESDYALYKGDTFIDVGTVKEIALRLGLHPDTIRHYSKKSYNEKFGDNAMILIKLDDKEE